MSTTALILIDFINEIVDPAGKLAAKGYSDFIAANRVFDHVQREVDEAHDSGTPIIAVALAFSPAYEDHPVESPVFGRAAEFGILREGTWSTAFTDAINLPGATLRVTKDRVSAFAGNNLRTLLLTQGIKGVRLCGVATDLAVEATARVAHDYDLAVEIAADACAAANADDHARSIQSMTKFARIN